MAQELMNIEELSDAYILCRTLGHQWDEMLNPLFSEMHFDLSIGAVGLRCIRCYTERYDYIGNDLKVFYRHYVYPPRYKTIPGQGTRS